MCGVCVVCMMCMMCMCYALSHSLYVECIIEHVVV